MYSFKGGVDFFFGIVELEGFIVVWMGRIEVGIGNRIRVVWFYYCCKVLNFICVEYYFSLGLGRGSRVVRVCLLDVFGDFNLGF